MDQVRIELSQRSSTSKHRYTGASPRGEVSELERDVSCPDENDTIGQRLELEKVGARFNVLLAWYPERRRASAAGNHEKSRFQLFALGHESIGSGESTSAMVGGDSKF